MKNTKIALGMIVKNDEEAPMLDRCLSTVASHVDGVYLTFTQKPYKKLIKVAEKYGAKWDARPGEFNHTVTKKEEAWLKKWLKYEPNAKAGETVFRFDEARNSNLNFIPDGYDWFFWIDTDDVLRKGELLKSIADKSYQEGWEAVFFNYLYQVELEGNKIKNVVIQHLRERLVRIDGDYRNVFKWVGSIHETLIQQRETRKNENKDVDVIHLSNHGRMIDALKRNMKVLETEIYKKKAADPRPIYYLAKAHYDLHTKEAHDTAERLMLVYLSPGEHKSNMSGWNQERAQAWEYLSEIYRGRKEFQASKRALFNALDEYPQFRTTYYSLALTCVLMGDYDTARFWAIYGSKIPMVTSTLVSNPRDLDARLYEVIYNCAINLNKIDEAWASAERLSRMFPENEAVKEQFKFISETKEIRDQLKNYMGLAGYLSRHGQTGKIKPLLAAAPEQIANNPMVVKLFQETSIPKTWEKNEIAFYCGQQFTPWGPKSTENPGNTFVGGSEEAVIYLTKELAKQGWKVTVYADPADDVGEFDGVNWQPYYNFNPRDNFNVLVHWRAVGYVDMAPKAAKTYLWAHDILNPAEFSKERLDLLDKVIVLSEAHRKNIPDVPDDKIMISTNGFYEYEK